VPDRRSSQFSCVSRNSHQESRRNSEPRHPGTRGLRLRACTDDGRDALGENPIDMGTRARLEAAFRAAPGGLDAEQLAERLGVHANTVRWHLGALARPHAGRGRGRGRLRIVYRATGPDERGTREEYRLLATVLSATLAVQTDGSAACEAAGLNPTSASRGLPAVPVNHRVQRLPLARLELGADRVRDRDQRDLRHLVVRDAEDLRRLALVHQVERRPDGAEPA
jgi:hypothetical protein